MRKCLVCNREMLRRTAADSDNSEGCYRHEEHIIQNALGGRLTSYEVLCESCGGSVNATIDAAFIKLFSIYTARFSSLLERERPINSSVRSSGFHNGIDLEINYTDGKYIPAKPKWDYDASENRLYVYAFERIIEHYVKFAVKEAEAKYGVSDFEIIRQWTFESSEEIELYFSKNNPDFNSQLAKGLTKISTEYAYSQGVSRESLMHHIDMDNKTFLECNAIYAFRPPTFLLWVMEYFRDVMDENYPNHTLMLYTVDYGPNKRKLYCYVELFGTFQYYVMLNDSYTGESLNTSFAQRLKAKPKPQIDFDQMEFKEFLSFAQYEGISLSEANYKDMGELREYISREFSKKHDPYEYNLGESVKSQLSELMKIFRMYSAGGAAGGVDSVLSYIEKMTRDQKIKLVLGLQQMFDNPSDTELLYRQVIDQQSEEELVCMAGWMFQQYAEDPTPFKEYGHHKFEMLYYLIDVYLRSRQQEVKKD